MTRVLRPLVRLMIRRGVPYPAAADLLRRLFVSVAECDFALAGRKVTDSRLSLLTGIQRREVKALRAAPQVPAADPAEPTAAAPGGHGPLPRVLARWSGDPAWTDRDGRPRTLGRLGADGFEGLVAGVSRDMHARTVLDELVRLGLVEARADGTVALGAEAFVPRADDSALLGYLAANLGDHAEAATANVAAAPQAGPYFERAVHYDGLSEASVAELDATARGLIGAALVTLNARAMALQARDRAAGPVDGADKPPSARQRFRAGAYVYGTPVDDDAAAGPDAAPRDGGVTGADGRG
ncbi:MAG: DUF6502 family protein [Pseudomonadota bacterium]